VKKHHQSFSEKADDCNILQKCEQNSDRKSADFNQFEISMRLNTKCSNGMIGFGYTLISKTPFEIQRGFADLTHKLKRKIINGIPDSAIKPLKNQSHVHE
jgi:hypothetical protein